MFDGLGDRRAFLWTETLGEIAECRSIATGLGVGQVVDANNRNVRRSATNRGYALPTSNPYAARRTLNPAERHLSNRGSCSDKQGQLYGKRTSYLRRQRNH